MLQQWSRHANSVAALHKTRQGPLQQEGADAALLQLQHCGKAFASLLALNKIHLKRIQVYILDVLKVKSSLLACTGYLVHKYIETIVFACCAPEIGFRQCLETSDNLQHVCVVSPWK